MNGLTRGSMYITFYHAIVACFITVLIVVPGFQIPRIIAGGNTGMWFTVGYILYLIVGAGGNAGFSQICRLTALSEVVKRPVKILGYISLILFNTGLMGATYMLMYAGYHAGYMEHVIPVLTGAGPDFLAIHEFLVVFVEPIGAFVIMTVIGMIVCLISLSRCK
ncbi:MAG: hypothetical protein ABIH76_05320 [Candidatus Bathyarchaeota archaeon]